MAINTTWFSNLSRTQSGARLCALIDQGAQGVANLVAIAALGRALAPDQFGVIGTAIGIYYFVAGFHRSAVVLPYITEHQTHDSVEAEARYHADWWWLNAIAACVLTAVLLLYAALVAFVSQWRPGWGWGVAPLVLAAAITPPLLCAEQARRWLYKLGRADVVALIACACAATLIGVAMTAAQWDAPSVNGWPAHSHTAIMAGAAASPWEGALPWVVAGMVGTIIPLAMLGLARLNVARSLACFTRHKRFAVWLSLTIIPYVVYSSATVVVLIGICNGPLAAAVFTAARTLTNPAISIVSAVDSIDKPRAAHALAVDGIAGLRHSVWRTRRLLIAVTGAYLALVALFAEPLLGLAFHHRYSGIGDEVRLLALAFFLFCLNQPSETMLIVLRASATMFVTRSATAVLTVGLLIAGSTRGVAGMAIGMAIAQAANLAFLYAAELHVSERWAMQRREVLAA